MPARLAAIPVRLALGLFSWTICGATSGADQEASPAAAASPMAQREFRDLPYVEGGDARQRMDLFLPVNPGNAAAVPAHPLVIWIHGGGWEQGTYHDCPARPMVALGCVVASIGYRFSNQAPFPAQIEDCKAAVRWLRAHAGEYHLDPRRIGVWGASAGGHLAALLGTTAGTRQFDVGANLQESSAVSCVIDSYGPTDFLHWGDPPVPDSADTPRTALAHLLGGTIHTHLELARAASPITYVDAHSAPCLILHGDRDGTVPVQQSIDFDAALHRAGVSSTLLVVPGAGHGGFPFGDPKYIEAMRKFFDDHLRSDAATVSVTAEADRTAGPPSR